MSKRYFECIHHIVPAGHIRQYARSTSGSQEEELSIAVNQYRPKYDACNPPKHGDVTILAGHASAFPKELYEPLFDALLLSLQRQSDVRIRSIWIPDVANQGASGVLNEEKMGNEPSWYDHARDYLAMVNCFRKEMPRPIIGLGHSMGGNILINLSLFHPRLLTTLVVVEPMINKSAWGMSFAGVLPISMKRDRWKSRDEAIVHFQKNVFYKAFDPKVVELFRQYGLREDPDGSITLTTTKDQEALSFGRAVFPPSREQMPQEFQPSRNDFPDLAFGEERNTGNAFYRPENTITYQMLPFLRPSCLYLHGASSHFAASSAEGRADKVRMTGVGLGGSGGFECARVQDETVEGSHFAPLEKPEAVAEAAAAWIAKEMERWVRDERREAEGWDKVPREKRARMSDDWKFWAQKMYGRTSKPKDKSKL